MIGCYAQTELGHGSNIRALETTATFVRGSDEFEIHSPSITATKWWSACPVVAGNIFAQMSMERERGKGDMLTYIFFLFPVEGGGGGGSWLSLKICWTSEVDGGLVACREYDYSVFQIRRIDNVKLVHSFINGVFSIQYLILGVRARFDNFFTCHYDHKQCWWSWWRLKRDVFYEGVFPRISKTRRKSNWSCELIFRPFLPSPLSFRTV